MLFEKKQQITICILAGMLVIDFALFGYSPLRKRMRAVKQSQAAQSLAIAKALAESEKLPALKEQLLKLYTKVRNYEARVPEQRDLGAFLHRIANLMNEHDLREQLIEPGKETNAGELTCIPVSMQCKGEVEQIFEFFKSLQNLDRLVRIEQIKLVNDRDFTGQASMQTKAVVYYRTEAEQG